MHGTFRRSDSSSRREYFLCGFLLPVISTFGCSQASAPPPGETFSAGYVFANKQPRIAHEFSVRNTSTRTVKILDVQRNCGCTSFSLDKRHLAAGEATKFTINVDVPTGYIPKLASCVLKTDHPRFTDWVYTVQFVSLPFIAADPDVLNLGSFGLDGTNVDASRNVAVDVFADSRTELTREMFSVPEEIDLQLFPNPGVRRLEKDVWNTRYTMSAGFSEKGREALRRRSRPGIITKAIELTAGESRHWSYSVYWQVLAPLACHPSFLSFGNLRDHREEHSRTITISSTTGERFRITAVKAGSPEVLVEAVYDPSHEAATHRLKITAETNKDTSRRLLAGSIQVQTTAKNQLTVDVYWSATLDRLVGAGARAPRSNSTSDPTL